MYTRETSNVARTKNARLSEHVFNILFVRVEYTPTEKVFSLHYDNQMAFN